MGEQKLIYIYIYLYIYIYIYIYNCIIYIYIFDISGQTALLLSVKEGHLKSVILFLENGADPLCSDEDNNSILSVAIINQHDDIIPLLLDHDVCNVWPIPVLTCHSLTNVI